MGFQVLWISFVRFPSLLRCNRIKYTNLRSRDYYTLLKINNLRLKEVKWFVQKVKRLSLELKDSDTISRFLWIWETSRISHFFVNQAFPLLSALPVSKREKQSLNQTQGSEAAAAGLGPQAVTDGVWKGSQLAPTMCFFLWTMRESGTWQKTDGPF